MADSISKTTGFRAFLAFAFSALVASCAGLPIQSLPDIPELKNQPTHDIPDVDLLAVSPDMKDFIDRHAYEGGSSTPNAWTLAYAVMSPHSLRFEYDPQTTLPADRAFRKGKGNCLTFSAMMIAMAREAGLEANFQEVEIQPEWTNVNDTMLVSKHVNATVHQKFLEYTIDVSRRKNRTDDRTRKMSDTEALAQFYNNLGAEALIEANNALAYAYFRKALELDRRLDYIWSNIGVILRRNGQTDEAVLAYRTALQLEPDQAVALNNLYVIFSEDGDLEAAAAMQPRVERNQRKNPWYVQFLAESAIEDQRYREAVSLAKRAVRMDRDEYRFHYTLARSQHFAGNDRLALESLERARKLAPTSGERDSLTLPGG
ncbi:MAG: tetratricopeptide repeat protein [Xanthomonadales bacterium]|nr:tetratricopeptide repeat protein [Gammaproteobacteria bacterium]MBT8053977.1 tetratricopeptide repeat protein [Gammaproteobacteria bacterium]NND58318.1 tetratricopeptide repeat protein [Xanthomonadales bacterium]NNK51971.1 tetratricopeptide repeat protein [Xanthomonadales bacterium]